MRGAVLNCRIVKILTLLMMIIPAPARSDANFVHVPSLAGTRIRDVLDERWSLSRVMYLLCVREEPCDPQRVESRRCWASRRVRGAAHKDRHLEPRQQFRRCFNTRVNERATLIRVSKDRLAKRITTFVRCRFSDAINFRGKVPPLTMEDGFAISEEELQVTHPPEC
jgi:hypothetical protein